MKGKWSGNTEVAMKTAGSKEQVEDVLREASLLRSLRHPHIVQLYGVALYDDILWLVTELAQGLEKPEILHFYRSCMERFAPPDPNPRVMRSDPEESPDG